MHHPLLTLLILLVTTGWWTLHAETFAKPPSPPVTPASPVETIYTEGRKTRDGIGKYYMGREIARVMGHEGIDWLERESREEEEAPNTRQLGDGAWELVDQNRAWL